MRNIAVFSSGLGSTLEHIIKSSLEKKINAKVSLVVSNKSQSNALKLAAKYKIEPYIVQNTKNNNSAKPEDELLNHLIKHKINFIILAGYLKKISPKVVEYFDNNIINTHPSLLPKYGGKGMYGKNVHRAVLENNEDRSGASIHYVNNEYDTGSIILQESIPIEPTDNIESLEEKIKLLEKKLLIEALVKVL